MRIPAMITFNMHDGTTVRWLSFAVDVEHQDGTFIDNEDELLRFLAHSPAPDSIAVSIGDDFLSAIKGLDDEDADADEATH